MTFRVKFSEQGGSFRARFGQTYNLSDGGYERGYAAGYEEGETEGYAKGVDDGSVSGLEDLFLKTIKRFSSDKVIAVESYTFMNCTELVELNIPNLRSVPISMCQNCAKLKQVIFPKITGGVGISAFQLNNSLEFADVGEATSIGAAAFYNCQSLHTLIIRGSSVAPMGNSNTLYNSLIYKGTGYIYVPDNLVDSYKAAVNWSTYASQIKPISELEE